MIFFFFRYPIIMNCTFFINSHQFTMCKDHFPLGAGFNLTCTITFLQPQNPLNLQLVRPRSPGWEPLQ